MLQLVCASANPDKVVEIGQLLGGVVDLRPRPAGLGEVIEDADTLTGNARLKATAVMEAAGLPAVADDTGLFVDVLDGAPGIYAARYAGDDCSYADNRRKLLGELEGAANRRAEFRTVAIVVWPDGAELAVEGVCTGVITMFERGGDGFGYDPVFEPDEGGGATFAEMTAEAKNAISHRGRAFEALLSALSER